MDQKLRDEIAEVAYDLYQKEGCPEGRELIHWLHAEKIVRGKYKERPEDLSVSAADQGKPTITKSRSGSRKKRNP